MPKRRKDHDEQRHHVENGDEFDTPTEFAGFFRVGVGVVRRGIKTKEIRGFRVGRGYRIPRSERKRIQREGIVAAEESAAEAVEMRAKMPRRGERTGRGASSFGFRPNRKGRTRLFRKVEKCAALPM
jgi:excisionase family DNA binding protein